MRLRFSWQLSNPARSLAAVSDLATSVVPDALQDRAFATLVSAFTDDPVERWLYPETHDYLTHFPEFLAAFGGPAFAERTVWELDDFAAVALWLPPGTEADGDAIVAVLTATVAADKLGDTFAVMEQMVHPTYPHWYLPWFGVDGGRQGQGLGSELMTRGLAIVDASHLPAYLESPNPRNVPFYERHGFEVTGQAQSGTCPPLTFMLRSAR
jgi:GNAT superfamily N-acetyltransferase